MLYGHPGAWPEIVVSARLQKVTVSLALCGCVSSCVLFGFGKLITKEMAEASQHATPEPLRCGPLSLVGRDHHF